MIDLNALQREVNDWAEETFGKRTREEQLLGVTKEMCGLIGWKLEELIPLMHTVRQLGNLCHHQDKQANGTQEFHDEKLKDAVGDIFLHLLDYCALRGWSCEDVIKQSWSEVSQREWIEDPEGGMARYNGEVAIPRGLRYDSKK